MIVVGTSGWQYADWRGRLYPDDLPQRLWLEYYAGAFATVEVNNAFYRLPERSTFEQWRERTPADFVVAVKMSRYLTHVRRLRDPAEPVARFLGRASALGRKLGPVLLQLPPNLAADASALDAVLREFREACERDIEHGREACERDIEHGREACERNIEHGREACAADVEQRPRDVRVAVEPRHSSWWTDEIRKVLEAHGAALCWADRRGRPIAPLWRTADFGYVRMHEGQASPRPRYGVRALDSWLARIDDAYAHNEDVFVYFNNDHGAAAVVDAATLAERARRRGLAMTWTPAPA